MGGGATPWGQYVLALQQPALCDKASQHALGLGFGHWRCQCIYLAEGCKRRDRVGVIWGKHDLFDLYRVQFKWLVLE
jgi:hypothetical protein